MKVTGDGNSKPLRPEDELPIDINYAKSDNRQTPPAAASCTPPELHVCLIWPGAADGHVACCV
jgi:hypothetical protein